MRTARIAVAAMVAAALVQGCGDDRAPITDPSHLHELATVQVEPASLSLEEGDTFQLTATSACECGQELSVPVTWASADPAVATVDESGLVTAVAEGDVLIVAEATDEGARIAARAALTVERDGVVVDATGGTVSYADGDVVLEVPEGALAEPTKITIRPSPADVTGERPDLVGKRAFHFRPEGLRFEAPARLSIAFDEADVPAGVDVDLLRLFHRTDAGWVELAESEVDVPGGKVSGPITGFSHYGVAAGREGDGGGGGGGPGNGGGGGGPGGGGGQGDLYADLVHLYRSVDGLPLLRELGGESCLQPVSYTAVPGLEPVTNPVNGEEVWLLPLVGDATAPAAVAAAEEDDGELEACDVQAEYADYVREVEIGRLNVGRAPDRVLDRALEEVYLKLANAETLRLDHAGRLAPDDAPIDAPGENLAIYRELTITGQLGGHSLPRPPAYSGFLDHGASGLGAAADKAGAVNEDLVVYYARILGLPDEVAGGMTTLSGDGTVGVAGRSYLDYGGFTYDRAETFAGCVIGFELVGDEMVRFEGTLMDLVFDGEPFTGSNVHGFARRSDDVRAVILFEHDTVIHSIDRIGETAVCEANDLP